MCFSQQAINVRLLYVHKNTKVNIVTLDAILSVRSK